MLQHDAVKSNDKREKSIQRWYQRLAIAGTALGILIITLAGAWAEARWPHAAGTYITVKSRSSADVADVLWQLRRVDGVRDAIAVFRSSLTADDIEGTGWRNVWFYANQTDASWLAFLPPDPTLRLHQGRLPAVHSLNEVVLGYELAQALHLGIGDRLTIQPRSFTVVGIWRPSSYLPGNFSQISAAAAESVTLSSLPSLDHFVVLPVSTEDAGETARRIWRKIPDVEVLSPEWELARASREHTILGLTLSAAVALAVLLSVLLSANLTPQREAWRVTVLAGMAGLAGGWGVAFAANLYCGHTLGLTPLQLTPRLALAVLALAGGLGLLAAWVGGHWPWSIRCATTALMLALCGTALVTLGTLNESLNVSLDEAQRTAADWVTLPGVQADAAFLRDVGRLPGVRGYTIEGYGGLANEDEERWVGPWPSSGVFYGMQVISGEGTLSVPYHLGYWRGGPLNPEKPDEAVVGYNLAQEQGLEVGDTMRIRDVPFTVVGIRERLRYDPDNDANYRIDISMEALRRVLHDPFALGELTLLVPPARSQQEKSIFLQEIGTRLNVGRLLTVKARLAEITRSYPAAWTLTQANALDSIRHARAIHAGIVVLCSVLLLAASALAVAGTMTGRLMQDELRVGLLKALGADEGMLLGDYLQMAAILGLAGGLPGVLGGWELSTWLNQLGSSTSVELLFTPRLGAAVFFFIVLTAMIAAIAPVSRAIRQDATRILYSTSLIEREAESLTKATASSPMSGTVTPGGSES